MGLMGGAPQPVAVRKASRRLKGVPLLAGFMMRLSATLMAAMLPVADVRCNPVSDHAGDMIFMEDE